MLPSQKVAYKNVHSTCYFIYHAYRIIKHLIADLSFKTALAILKLRSFLWFSAVPHNVTITDSTGAAILTNSTTVDIGDALVLNCNASGGPGNTYRWFKDDVSFDTDRILYISSVKATEKGQYECRASNYAGYSSAKVNVSVITGKWTLMLCHLVLMKRNSSITPEGCMPVC